MRTTALKFDVPEGTLPGLIAAAEGNLDKCMAMDLGEFDPGDKQAFCAWLIEQPADGPAEPNEGEATKADIENTRSAIQAAIQDKYESQDLWVETFDPDEGTAIYTSYDGMKSVLLQINYTGSGESVAIGDEPPVEVVRRTVTEYSTKSSTELTGPIVAKSAAKQIAYAAVLVPGEADSDGESLTAEKIEEVAHGWMENYRNIDVQHTLNNLDALPVESHILRQPETVTIKDESMELPAGSWVLASKFNDPDTWAGIESGEYTGYSVMGVRRAAMETAAKSSTAFAFKKTLLEDLGEDWVATHVSVVDEPAVPKAKWFALKRKATEPTTGLKSLLRSVFAPADHADKVGMQFSTSNANKLSAIRETAKQLISDLDDIVAAVDAERQAKGKSNKALAADEIASAVKEGIRRGTG